MKHHLFFTFLLLCAGTAWAASSANPLSENPLSENALAGTAPSHDALSEKALLTKAVTNCLAGNCINGYGKARLNNGDLYQGHWKDGLMHGTGVYTYSLGARYEGEFVDGRIEGQGVMRYPDGAYYTGAWRKNRKHGAGALVLPSGEIRKGDWVNGKLDRDENANLAANSPATNQHVETQQHADTGKREQNKRRRDKLPDCNGTFCDEGDGRYVYRDGTEYIGGFEDGQPSGEGVVTYANGDRYEGGWFQNAPDGRGTYIFGNGRQLTGVWSEGKLLRRIFQDRQDESRLASGEASTDGSVDRAADGRADMYAVVVGIGAYNAMQTLRYTDDDAYQMYAFLKSPEGGALRDDQLELLIDEVATRERIEKALERTLERADADDIVVFYYSGHGVDGFFVPVDFDGSNNLLSFRRVEELLARSAAKHKLVLADACHSGGLLAARSATASSSRLYDAFLASEGGTALLLSSRSEEVSLESNGLRSGVFSHYLMRGIKGEADADGNAVVTVTELFDYIAEGVNSYTARRQTPVLSGNFDRNMPVAILR